MRSDDLYHALKKRVSGEVRFDPVSRSLYSTDASIYQIDPIGVVIPRDSEDVFAAVDVAREFQAPILPRGAGTSLAGQAIGAAIVLDLSKRLNRVLAVNTEERWALVEPGVVQEELNAHLKPFGFHFGPDTATANQATIGGMIGNNSAGAHSIRYGKTVDHVVETDVVLASGERYNFREIGFERARRAGGLEGRVADIVNTHCTEIVRRFPPVMRRVSGYNLDEFVRCESLNLSKLVVGSEGTLALVHAAKVRIEPRPSRTVLMVAHFEDVDRAIRSSQLAVSMEPAAVELVDDTIIDLARKSLGMSRIIDFVEGRPGAILLIEFSGDNEVALRSRLDELEALLKRNRLGYAYSRLTDPDLQQNAWNVRKAGLGLLLGMKGDRKPIAFIEDCAVDLEKLPGFVARFRDVIQRYGTTAGYYGHASVGCLHIRPLLDMKHPRDIRTMKMMSDEISDLVLEFGGAMSGEHGDGLARSYLNEKLFGPQVYKAFRDVKRTFDPENRMNPGKIVDAPAMDQNLRYGGNYETIKIHTHYDFSPEGGLAAAVERCNGVGACRKKAEGTMCPSYMATMEEKHSTRGRANVLRAILSGTMPAHEFTGQALYEVMDLCLECKGCKAECPSSVDMAKLKYEFLAHYYEQHGLPARAWLFGHIHRLSRAASRWPAAANRALANPLIRRGLDRFLGIDSRRKLPAFAEETFERWFGRTKAGSNAGTAGRVVLFDDTFMNFNVPQVGKAATEILEAAGYEVRLAEPKCCGRPMISKGLADLARAHAKFNAEHLYPFLADGYNVVGCEPSCILTFRDEYPALIRGPQVDALRNRSFLFEEFIVRERQAGRWKLEFKPQAEKALAHTHCHERALVGSGALKEALSLAYTVEEIDAGCCGMAGSFGYETEHYDTSMAIGRRGLFARMELEPDALVVTSGFSCRRQIEDATGRKALHPVEVLRQAIE